MDTDFESRLRDADPAAGFSLRDDPHATLSVILERPAPASAPPLSTRPARRPPRRPRGPGRLARIGLVAACVALLAGMALVMGVPWLGPSKAVAGRVPALVATDSGQSREEALDELLARAEDNADPDGYDPHAYRMKVLSESVVPEGAGGAESHEVFSPISEVDVVTSRLPDGTYQARTTHLGIISARTGERIPAVDVMTGKTIPPGTETLSLFTPEDNQMGIVVPDTAATIDVLTRNLSAPDSALFTGSQEVALFEVLGFAMRDWNPSQAQSAAVLELLAEHPGVVFDGKVTDRMGRPGLMFSAVGSYAPGYDQNDRYTYRHSFVFDPETGHLNAYEEVAGQDIDYFMPGGTLNSVTVAAP